VHGVWQVRLELCGEWSIAQRLAMRFVRSLVARSTRSHTSISAGWGTSPLNPAEPSSPYTSGVARRIALPLIGGVDDPGIQHRARAARSLD